MQFPESKSKVKKRIPFKSLDNKIYQFISSNLVSPHPDKIQKGGEDAVFVSKNVLAVADGVGGWKDVGIDPGIYSKKLVENIATLLEQEQKQNYYIDNPLKLACDAVNMNKAQGSTTLSIITLHPKSGLLRTYHIGDSIYGIFHRNGEQIVGAQQQHLFNHPYQVGSNFIHHKSNQQMCFCQPDRGIYNQFNLNQYKDSYIVLASDGIWDNLFPHQIHEVLFQSSNLKSEQNEEKDQKHFLEYAVNKLIKLTKSKYEITNYESPFYLKGKQVGLNVGKFAKIDDLSLIIAKVASSKFD